MPELGRRLQQLNGNLALIVVPTANFHDFAVALFLGLEMQDGQDLTAKHLFAQQNKRTVRVYDERVGFFGEAVAVVAGAADADGDGQQDAQAAPLLHEPARAADDLFQGNCSHSLYRQGRGLA